MPAEKVLAYQERYLNLVAEGKTEREIDAMIKAGKIELCYWETRYKWQENEDFKTQCQRARAQGAEFIVSDFEGRLNGVWNKIVGSGDVDNRNLGSLLAEVGRHARWRASKDNNKRFGDKLKVEHDEVSQYRDLTPAEKKILEKAGIKTHVNPSK